MNLAPQLRKSAQEIGQRILAMQQSGTLGRPSSMNPNEVWRSPKRGPVNHTKPQAFRFAYSTTRTSTSSEPPRHGVKIMAGLNELDAEIHLRQYLTNDGLHLREILRMEPVTKDIK